MLFDSSCERPNMLIRSDSNESMIEFLNLQMMEERGALLSQNGDSEYQTGGPFKFPPPPNHDQEKTYSRPLVSITSGGGGGGD